MGIFSMFAVKCKREKELEQEIELLKTQISECEQKVSEKQEHINRTNAYWKRKFYELKKQRN